MSVTLICEYCEKPFSVIPYAAKIRKFCSRKCSANAQRVPYVEITCQICGKKFSVPPSIAKLGRKFCSHKCRWKAQTTKVTLACQQCGKRYTRYSDEAKSSKFCSHKCQSNFGRITLSCKQCGKSFTIKKSLASKGQTLCSRECKGLFSRRGITLTCKQCKKPFSIAHWRAKGRKFCSKKCQREAQKESRTLICPRCEREFTVMPGEPKRMYCSKECRTKKVILVCRTCGKEYSVPPNQAKRSKTCSQQCRTNYKQWITLTCRWCEKEYRVPPSGAGRKFCSKKCSNRDRDQRVTLTCPQCGKMFLARGWKVKNGRRFCCDRCARIYQGPSSIEILLRDELSIRNISFENEYPFRQFSLDFALPEHKIAIECDGVYWHSSEEVKARDQRKDEALRSEGWTVLRFAGDEIRESVTACVDSIVKELSPLRIV